MDVIKVFKDADEIAMAALDYVLKAAVESIVQKGVFNLVLAGGSTPEKLYELLANRTGIDWSKWQFFMGDERYVPHDDERSNQKMADKTLLSKISIDASQIHAVPVAEPTVQQAAERYQEQILDYFGHDFKDPLPVFDLILLGLGSDGHTASLFPGKPALEETKKLVIESEPGVLPPPVDRITFTFPLINATHRVLFLAAGADKTEAFAQVRQDLEKPPADAVTPAGRVRPSNGELHWFVGRDMAG
jgi:6-phosphogluconolactonase